MLASKFASTTTMFRSPSPLTEEQMQRYAPSIFAEGRHESRSERYTYIPTISILRNLQKEGFQPFMVCQSGTRDAARSEHTKHMIRLRQAGDICANEANEIILLNSHDGTSAYQMLAGVFRFVCSNGLVRGSRVNEIRIPHKGNIVDNVIDGAFRVVETFDDIDAQRDNMKAVTLSEPEQIAFAGSALKLKYDDPLKPAPVSESQVLYARRHEDRRNDLWTVFNRVQENMVMGNLAARTATGQRTRTRQVKGIDGNLSLNKALWHLADEMRKLKQSA